VLGAIIEAGLRVDLVVLDRSCQAAELATAAGIPVAVVARDSYGADFDRVAYTHRVVDALLRHNIDVVAMAGFGTILAPPFFDVYAGRVLNTHPALLPAFKGWHAVRDALAAGVKVTGTTVHVATEEVDAGPILAQEPVPVVEGDTEETLHERIKQVERRLYPDTILKFLETVETSQSPHRRSRPMRVLMSVYDKTGLEDFARQLVELGHEIVASGGTAAALEAAGVAHRTVESLTEAPEMLGGRVKTLHPRVHGGILADLAKPEHLADLEAQRIEPIGLVVCNLYPFRSNPSIELIDVGGPTMVRAAAKNWAHVGSVVDPADYSEVLAELREDGALSDDLRRRLAASAFAHTAAYDAAIANWFADQTAGDALPQSVNVALEKAQTLRYGENPHQRGARYRVVGERSWWDEVEQHGGMELSYLNLYDADAAWRLAHQLADLGAVAAVVVKHANPCGAAVADDVLTAYDRAFDADPMSAFGGIVALTSAVTEAVAQEMVGNAKADVLIAPSYDPAALELFAAKRKNMRVLSAPPPGADRWHLRQIGGGWLVQDPYVFGTGRSDWRVVTKAQPTEDHWTDMELAWRVCAWVKSNAIVLAAAGMAVGIGGGQQNRVTPAEIATARAAGRAKGGAAASDAFFPFRDGLDACAAAGVASVIQPGGSVRDDEVIAAADEHGLVMVFTGERQFQH
jgi:phosphoribosylaminoimidazolecarboxamide formyltransferase/IMP cyclohydrolase